MILAVLFFFGSGTNSFAVSPLTKQVKTLTVSERIAYDTRYVDLPERYRGYSEVQRPGTEGERKIEMQVLYEGGRAVRILSMRASEVAKPIDAVVRRGTKVLHSRTVSGQKSQVSFINPLPSAWLSADFYDYPQHNGIDLAAAYGAQVLASAAGVVSLAGWYGEYGRCIIVDHPDGSQTLYAHNSSLEVSKGAEVKQGQEIAKVGSTGNSTGNHLHFELRLNDKFLDPLMHIDK